MTNAPGEPLDSLPPEVIHALRSHKTIEAIQLLRASKGIGLEEAKCSVDAYLEGKPSPLLPWSPGQALPDTVAGALQQGNQFEAIRLLREQTGLGLKEAKDAVEAAVQGTAPAKARSPGEVPQARGLFTWGAAGCVATAAAWYFLRG